MNQLEAFRILASADRQLVLTELLEQKGETPIEDLSKRVAAERHQTSPNGISDKAIENAKIRLIHNHFPLMDEKKIINVSDDDMVSLNNEECVNKLLEAAKELEAYPADKVMGQQSHRS